MKGKSPHFNGITSEARWYIIGAYLADGTISDISSHLNLSENTIQTVINNFKSTGIPSYRRKKGKFTSLPYHNQQQQQQQNIKESSSSIPLCKRSNKISKAIDSNNNNNKDIYLNDNLISTLPERNIRSISKNKGNNNKSNRQRSGTASDCLLSKLLHLCRIYENKRFDLWQNEQSKKTIKMDDHSIKLNQSKPSISSSSQLIASIQQQQQQQIITTPLSIITSTISDSSIQYHGINNNEFIPWTTKDDKILLGHVFYFDRTLKKWGILEQIFEGRHIADDCKERWASLAPILMNEMKNLNDLESITPW